MGDEGVGLALPDDAISKEVVAAARREPSDSGSSGVRSRSSWRAAWVATVPTASGQAAGDLAAVKGIGTPAGAVAALWNHSFINEPRKASDRTPWPTFTGPEMADLLAYLRSLGRK